MKTFNYRATLLVVEKLSEFESLSWKVVQECWQNSLLSLGSKSYKKGCPKNAITSLVLNGHVKLKEKKVLNPGNFRSIEYEYCKVALRILKGNPTKEYTNTQLWNEVKKELKISRSSQGEMDILLCLWENNLLN